MLESLLFKGALIGFSVAMPVGPIGLLCMRNSLTMGARYGFITGLGAAVADTVYGAIAGFGLVSLMTFLMSYKLYLQLVGGIFLSYLGLKTFLAKESNNETLIVSKTLSKIFFSTFFLTITNPMTILSFVGIYAGLGIGTQDSSSHEAFLLTLGVFLGSTVWWLILSSSAILFKNKFNSVTARWINRISGSVLIGFGALALAI